MRLNKCKLCFFKAFWAWVAGAEDFSFYGETIPAFIFYLGARNEKLKLEEAPSHHSPDFYFEDNKLDVGIRAFCQLVFDYSKNK